ncbi:MAG: uracil-DNA glycosylase [Candidatus Woesearchaeota archaeon]
MDSFSKIAQDVKNCTRCELHETRRAPLVGEGPHDADVMILGESPGYSEDMFGKHFIGEAGRLLDGLLGIGGIERDKVYITNVLKCHPPRNHNPSRGRIDACLPFLKRQLALIEPRLIVTLGKYATQVMCELYQLLFTRISQMRGQLLTGSVLVFPTFHPAYACHHPEKRYVLEDDFAALKKVVSNF